ncbi:hypothetical protein Plo01_15320 [Planobispora longispora]|uniref:Uncharacterized protein n=2 Tax=Planobispora longispora TaxID=28887 RepID=A0A8J3RMS6_9ACTN|nr:hypothetical protein GCM10020093_078580 [Planobispora longispora]GIH75103.1 hypothetical protein Plo01_15320 [Planobispora longispora]
MRTAKTDESHTTTRAVLLSAHRPDGPGPDGPGSGTAPDGSGPDGSGPGAAPVREERWWRERLTALASAPEGGGVDA